MSTYSQETTGQQVVQQFQDVVQGKTILITGTSEGGLGAETAISLAHAKPAQLLLLARSERKVRPVIEEINSISPSTKTAFILVELDDFDSVRKAAATVNNSVSKLDILINNAGIMAVLQYKTNKSGIESQFATNHLGHFLLTTLVFDRIKAAGKDARIVNVTSDGYTIGPCRMEDYNFRDGKEYDPWSAYGQSKTANVLFTRELASQGVLSFAAHPGVIMSTGLGGHVEPKMFEAINGIAIKNTGQPFTMGAVKDGQQGCATTLVAALDPRLKSDSGSYMQDCAVYPMREYASSLDNAKQLWTLSEKLVGQQFVL